MIPQITNKAIKICTLLNTNSKMITIIIEREQMHLLAASAVIATIAKKFNCSKSDTLSIKGIIEVRHSIDSRIRVHIPSLKDDQTKAEKLESDAGKVDAIQSVKASPVTGSVTICFDQSQIAPVLVLGIVIKLLGLDAEINNAQTAHLEKEITTVTKSLDKSLLKVSNDAIDIKSGISILILAGLVISVAHNKASLAILPTPITLLWWLYQNNIITKNS